MRLITCLMLLVFVFPVFSQEVSDKKLKEAAADICDCLSPSVKKLHPRLITMIITMAEKGEQKAEEELMAWMSGASADEQGEFSNSLEFLQHAFPDSTQKCMAGMETKYQDMDKDPDQDQLMRRLTKAMESVPDCKLLSNLMKIGFAKKEEEDN